jgi:hypothetical protein
MLIPAIQIPKEISEMRRETNTSVICRIVAGRGEARAGDSQRNVSRLSPLVSLVRYAIFCAAPLLLPLLGGATAVGQSNDPQAVPAAGPAVGQPVGPGQVFVHSKFGGQIFGFDIDQNGTEGLLTEAKSLSNGNVLAAVETFDQKTGKIFRVVKKLETKDDFVTYGVVGKGIGLVEHEHVQGLYVTKRTYKTLNPLDSNMLNGEWTPPIDSKHIIMPTGVSRSQGVHHVAIFAYDNSGNFIPDVFESNVAKNTFGPVVEITDSLNFASIPPPIAYDSATRQAILGGGDGCFDCFPVIGLVDLVKGTFSEFTGTGFGFINGIAVDSDDGIFCTTTEDDATVEFYTLATHESVNLVLPGSDGQQFYSGADVEFDPIHKLFLVAQPNSSSAPSGSTIYVYSPNGTLQETLNGFNFSNVSNVVPAHMALHPSMRSGYVDGPDAGVSELQSFAY